MAMSSVLADTPATKSSNRFALMSSTYVPCAFLISSALGCGVVPDDEEIVLYSLYKITTYLDSLFSGYDIGAFKTVLLSSRLVFRFAKSVVYGYHFSGEGWCDSIAVMLYLTCNIMCSSAVTTCQFLCVSKLVYRLRFDSIHIFNYLLQVLFS